MAALQLQTISKATNEMDNNDKQFLSTIGEYVSSPSPQSQSAPNTISGGTVFSDATKGLSLNSGSALAMTDQYANEGFDYQRNSTSAYDVQQDPYKLFIDALGRDKDGKLIGSAPKIGANAQLKVAGSDGTSKTDSGMGMTIAGEVGKTVGDTLTALENTAVNDYQNDMTFWESQGKYWFNPNSEIKPDLDKYLANMPSAVDALRNSGMNALQKGKTDSFGEGAYNMLLNPAATKGTNPGLMVLNPATPLFNAFDRKAGQGFSGYVGSQAAKGAMSGMAGGGIGAGVGAVVGVVKGIFTWFSAKGEDAANKKKAKEEYEIALREWTLKKNQRQIAEQEADFQNRQNAEAQISANEEAKKEKAEAKKLQRISEGRAMLKSVLMNAGKSSQAYRDRRAQVKSSRRV